MDNSPQTLQELRNDERVLEHSHPDLFLTPQGKRWERQMESAWAVAKEQNHGSNPTPEETLNTRNRLSKEFSSPTSQNSGEHSGISSAASNELTIIIDALKSFFGISQEAGTGAAAPPPHKKASKEWER